MAWNQDLSDFDEANNDRVKIEKKLAVPCRTCEHIFGRLRLTWIFCVHCNKGVCMGEHGLQKPNSRITKCVEHWD